MDNQSVSYVQGAHTRMDMVQIAVYYVLLGLLLQWRVQTIQTFVSLALLVIFQARKEGRFHAPSAQQELTSRTIRVRNVCHVHSEPTPPSWEVFRAYRATVKTLSAHWAAAYPSAVFCAPMPHTPQIHSFPQ